MGNRLSKARLQRLICKMDKTANEKKLVKYYTKLHRATPAWLSAEDRSRINAFYKKASAEGLTVDHIVPLGSTLVCGLHVPWNLQALPHKENNRKSNTWWPDCPIEQGVLI